MLRFPRALPDRLLNPKERLQRETQDLRFQRQECRRKLRELKHGVAVVGGGFAGVMAAWELSQHGVKVTVYEAHNEVGGRVRSNPTWSEGRITEEGAELIGSFHTQWLGLARQYGLAMISRMDSDLYHRAGLDVKLTLDQPLSMPEFEQLSKAMEKRILRPIALLALGIRDPSRPWKQRTLLTKFDGMSVQDALPKFCPIAKRTKGNKDERLWKMIEFKLVNDEVAPLDEMNFLGLLCKVRAGQGKRFGAGLPPILMGYWDELEIFRCADGCQQLAKEMTTEISQKYGKIWPNIEVKVIDISKDHVTLTWVPVRQGKPDSGSGQSERFDYVIFAVPPSVWNGVTINVDGSKVDPTVEIGQIGMAPAVKFFSDVKERFWIKKAAAPYGGSLRCGQVWEGTDNQTRVEVQKCDPKRQEKQGIVLSVFAGPLLPGPRVPTEQEFKDELKKLYSGDYDPTPVGNVRKTLFANWPDDRFIKTGYVSPKINQLLDIGEKLSKPFHDRLFFAGEHTQMDFFGYMEGALRSGERAAHTLMLKACGLLDQPAPKAAGGSGRPHAAKTVSPPRPTPAREAAVFQRGMRSVGEVQSSAGDAGEAESPFLHQELFADSTTEEFETRAAALVAESPFAGALDERRSSFDEEELTKGEVLDEFEEAGELEPERMWGEVEDEQDDDSVDDERALLREDETELESPEGLEEVYGHAREYEPEALAIEDAIDLEDTDHEFGLADESDADQNYDDAEEEIEEPELELEEVADEREDEDKYVPLLTKDDAARHGDPRRELEEREAPAPGFESQTGTDKTPFTPKATDRFIILVSGYNYRDHNDDYDELTRNRARLIASRSRFKSDDKLVFVWFSVTAGRVFVNRRTKSVWKLKNTADWTPIDEFKFNDAHSQSFSFEAIDRTKHYGNGKTFRQDSANTVMSIVNVYEFITNLGRHRTGSVMELSIISHGFWNGPILVNSSDNAASGSASRDPSDKDGRGRKDFLEDNIDTTLVHDAFHVDGFSWIWGCFAAQAPLAVIQGVADSRFKKTPWGKRVKGVDGAVYRADGKTPDTATFLFSLGKNQTELFSKEWDASFFPTGMESFKKTFGEIKEFAKKHSDDTYCRSLTIASDKPCYGPPLGASTNYAAKDPYRPGVPVIHWVERGKKRPPPESGFEANYDATINFFLKSMSMPEDPEKRGYVRYSL